MPHKEGKSDCRMNDKDYFSLKRLNKEYNIKIYNKIYIFAAIKECDRDDE